MEEMMKDTQAAQSAAQPTAGAQAEKKPRFSLPKGKKGKKWLKILIAVAVVAAIAVGCVANAAKKANSQIAGGYLVAQAVRQDLDAVRHRYGDAETRGFLQCHHAALRHH